MTERKPLLLNKIENAIIAFFMAERAHIIETAIYVDGRFEAFDAYALAVAIERAIDEAMAEQMKWTPR